MTYKTVAFSLGISAPLTSNVFSYRLQSRNLPIYFCEPWGKVKKCCDINQGFKLACSCQVEMQKCFDEVFSLVHYWLDILDFLSAVHCRIPIAAQVIQNLDRIVRVLEQER